MDGTSTFHFLTSQNGGDITSDTRLGSTLLLLLMSRRTRHSNVGYSSSSKQGYWNGYAVLFHNLFWLEVWTALFVYWRLPFDLEYYSAFATR